MGPARAKKRHVSVPRAHVCPRGSRAILPAPCQPFSERSQHWAVLLITKAWRLLQCLLRVLIHQECKCPLTAWRLLAMVPPDVVAPMTGLERVSHYCPKGGGETERTEDNWCRGRSTGSGGWGVWVLALPVTELMIFINSNNKSSKCLVFHTCQIQCCVRMSSQCPQGRCHHSHFTHGEINGSLEKERHLSGPCSGKWRHQDLHKYYLAPEPWLMFNFLIISYLIYSREYMQICVSNKA